MRVLVVSDIHGNRAALDTVAAVPHDVVICLGDIVGYGPEPAACLSWVAEHATWVVQGNHDRAFGEGIPPRCRPNFAWLADAVTPFTKTQLGADDLAFLRGLPRWTTREVDGVQIACVHASPSDPLYGYRPPDPAIWARELERVDADLLLVGHTHVPMDFTIRGRRVVNPGSVGQPKDGNPCAAFGLIVDGVPTLARASYPIEETVAALEATPIDRRAVGVLAEMLRAGSAPP